MTTYDFNKFCSFIDNLSVTVGDAIILCDDQNILQSFLDILISLYEVHHIESEKISFFDDDHILISGKMESLKPLIDQLEEKLDSLR